LFPGFVQSDAPLLCYITITELLNTEKKGLQPVGDYGSKYINLGIPRYATTVYACEYSNSDRIKEIYDHLDETLNSLLDRTLNSQLSSSHCRSYEGFSFPPWSSRLYSLILRPSGSCAQSQHRIESDRYTIKNQSKRFER
jgi:hypothetical protein